MLDKGGLWVYWFEIVSIRVVESIHVLIKALLNQLDVVSCLIIPSITGIHEFTRQYTVQYHSRGAVHGLDKTPRNEATIWCNIVRRHHAEHTAPSLGHGNFGTGHASRKLFDIFVTTCKPFSRIAFAVD